MDKKIHNRGFHVEDDVIKPYSYIGKVGGRRFQAIRNHPLISLAVAGIALMAGLGFLRYKCERYMASYHSTSSEYNFPLEELALHEPVCSMENVFNEEKTWDEYSEAEKSMFEQRGITNEESYINYAEGRVSNTNPDTPLVNN